MGVAVERYTSPTGTGVVAGANMRRIRTKQEFCRFMFRHSYG